MNELDTTEILIEKLKQKVVELKKNGSDNLFADICVRHTNDKLTELLKFLSH
jgi:hypothetical protein